MSENIELKPCPFCDGCGCASFVKDLGWRCQCVNEKCDVKPQTRWWEKTAEKAIETWNARGK